MYPDIDQVNQHLLIKKMILKKKKINIDERGRLVCARDDERYNCVDSFAIN